MGGRSPSRTLEEYVKSRGGGFRALSAVHRDIQEGRLKIVDPNPPKTYVEYLARLDYSLWLWTLIAIVALTAASVYLSNLVRFVLYVRYVLGSILVLFAVGYATVEVLYPSERSLSNLERLALSIGLSLAIVPLVGLVLNYSPWGIRLEPALTSLAVYTTLTAFGAAYRKYRQLRVVR
ncbi:MAG: DUF1616 domain-containing protein [Candidatus Nezhaarchaeota archaeon]|nr:DUF1616 domain-containing protein [Candidatus Nezhaarchaeota archaeon]